VKERKYGERRCSASKVTVVYVYAIMTTVDPWTAIGSMFPLVTTVTHRFFVDVKCISWRGFFSFLYFTDKFLSKVNSDFGMKPTSPIHTGYFLPKVPHSFEESRELGVVFSKKESLPL